MNKKLLLSLLFVFGCLPFSFSQNLDKIWESNFDGTLDGFDQSRNIICDHEGNSFITGTSYHTTSKGNFTTIKYDAAGNQQWESSDAGTQTSSKSEGRKLVMAKDGMVYGIGTLSYHAGDLAIIKYSPNGKLWAKSYEPYWFGSDKDFGVDIAVDSFSNIYTVSQITSLNGELWDLYVLKTDSGGNKIYEDDYSSASGDDYTEGVVVSPGGTMYALASCFNFFGSGTYDINTIKYLDNGNQDWLSKYDGPGSDGDYGTFIRADASENSYVCGTADAGGSDDMVAYKQNLYGTRLWTVTYSGTANFNDTAVSISYLPGGLVAVTGNSVETDGATNKRAIVTMLIDSGTVLWTNKYFGTNDAGATVKAMVTDDGGNIYLCGNQNNATGTDAILVKYNTTGAMVWNEVFNGSANLDDSFNSMVLDDSLYILVTGQSYTTAANANYVTVKYSQFNVATAAGSVNMPAANDLKVFPNPAIGNFITIHASFKKGDNLEIFDNMGKMVYRKKINAEFTQLKLQGLELPNGMYVITLKSEQQTSRARLTIQK